MIEVSPELLAFLRTEYDRCRDDALQQERSDALDYYNGEPFGDEEEGRSQLVTRDVAEVTDYMVISILRTLVSGDRVVEFTHSNAEKAQEATVALEHLFMEEQNGYLILHDWLKAGLLEKNAVCMTYPEPQPAKRVTVQIDTMQMMVAQESGTEFVEAEEIGEGVFNAVYLEPQPPLFIDCAVPNEEFYCSPDARTIDEAALKGRETPKSISDLVEMGFEEAELETVGHEHDWTGILSGSRDENRNIAAEDRKGPNRVVKWQESFVRFDENGDGIAELLFVQHIGDHIFSIGEMEEVTDQPFEDWCPFPMPHRRIGQSLADKVMDIQRTRSVILRQSLDGMYFANNPRTYVNEDSMGENTIDDLLTVRPGAIVRWKGSIKPETHDSQFNSADGFSMLEFMAGERETRTGITRLNQGLDADTLNKTASGQAQLQARGEQYEEYLARNFANALARLFAKKARLLKRHGKPIQIQIDGEFREVDPSQWPDDMIAKPRVGLGSGRKEQRLVYRQQILQLQQICIEGGLPIVGPEQVFNSAKGAIADMNLGVATDYFIDPATIPEADPNAPQPKSPEEIKADADAAAVQRKLDAMEAEMAAKFDLKAREAEEDKRLARDKAEFEAAQAREAFEFEREMALDRADLDEELARRSADRADYESETKLKKLRPGGDLAK
jgi:hypothetical protein